MQLMIPLPLTLPDVPLSLVELETAVHAWGLAIQQRALALAWQAQAALRLPVPCPACDAPQQRRAGNKARKVEPRFGPVRLTRQRVRCRGCGRYFQPDDAALMPLLGAGQCTPMLRELAAQCGASWPYRQAAQVLALLRGAPLAAETVRRMVAKTGGAVERQYADEARRVCRPPATAPPPVPSHRCDWRSSSMARGFVAGTTPTAWRSRSASSHTGSERCGTTRRRLVQRRYAATAHGVAPFGPLVTAGIDHVGGFAATEQTLLGDGAAWIWRLGTEIIPVATQVLDRWHLREARRRATRAAVPDKEVRQPWSARLEDALDGGDVPSALNIVGEMQRQHPHRALGEFAGYLRTHAGRIPDYAARQAAGRRSAVGRWRKGWMSSSIGG